MIGSVVLSTRCFVCEGDQDWSHYTIEEVWCLLFFFKQKTAYEIGLGIPAEPLFRSLSKQQQVSEIMRQMLTQAQTAGQYFTNDQIKEMTRKVSAEVDLVHQQTQNQRYGSSHIGATAKDISNVVTDAASGVVDI